MPQITLDPAATERLRAADGPTELVDADGVAYATLTPLVSGPTHDLAAHGWTEDEIKEVRREAKDPATTWSSPEEVWERIFAEYGRPDEERV